MCYCRIDSLASALFLSLLDVLSARPRHVAGSLLAPILQGQETHRVVHSFLLLSDECAVVLVYILAFLLFARLLGPRRWTVLNCMPFIAVHLFHLTDNFGRKIKEMNFFGI